MRTKMGSYMVKKWTKKMNVLNKDAVKLGKSIYELGKTAPVSAYEDHAKEIVGKYILNREKYRATQSLITAMVGLEEMGSK